MALYALDGDRFIFAGEAEEKKIYRCAGCSAQVKVRRGPFRVPHYYHQRKSPSCRLYSKSEDHMLAQLSIQALLPRGEALIEQPLVEVNRVADVLWKPRKIVFEIQCSFLTPHEAKQRVLDYAQAGYQVVWILDDRLYNRRKLRPAESLVRTFPSYYATLRKQTTPIFYDQFEIFDENRRLMKGQRLRIDLDSPQIITYPDWETDNLPQQIVNKSLPGTLYFEGDLIFYALLSKTTPTYFHAMLNLKSLEIQWKQKTKKENSLIRKIILHCVLEPFGLLMIWLLDRAAETN